ncbi:sn-1-specific diacylglycerol lipase ABHD11-like [Diabrotica undecimpunctata]|uniref:sn-1-specific diacylglycerol lipase ABHD11-like n=1 Tax=Diabrotica undecimpunctata TaxID=50387 RepID=UPI003B636C26
MFLSIKNQIPEFLICFKEINLFKKSSTSNVEDVKPVKLAYKTYDKRAASPLMIIHALFGNKTNWSTIGKSFNESTIPRRKVIIIDCRNHGESPHTESHTYTHIVADLKALLDSLSIQRLALLGHSMGGRASMLFSLKYPNMVEKLIVGDTSPISGMQIADFLPIIDTLMNIKIPTNVSLSEAKKHVDAQLNSKITNTIVRNFLLSNLIKKEDGSINWKVNFPVLKKDLQHMWEFPLDDTMKYEGPTLFVAGQKSSFLPKSDFPEIKKYFPKAELIYINGASHWLHQEKPREFLDITLEFLNRPLK